MGANVDHHLLEEKNLGTLGKKEGWGEWWGLSGFCRSGMSAEDLGIWVWSLWSRGCKG